MWLDVLAELPRKYSLSEDRTELTVTDVQNSYRDVTSGKLVSDIAVIQCNASNEHGSAYMQAYINVLGTHMHTYVYGIQTEDRGF